MPLIDTSTDGHVHTRFCHHASGEMEDYVISAIEKGFERIIFLEHLEAGINYFEPTWLTGEEFGEYHEIGGRLKLKYKDIIDIGLGVEVGYNPEKTRAINDFLRQYQWDRIGISYHFYAYGNRHINMLSRKKNNLELFDEIGIDLVIESYLDGLMDAVGVVQADVLCHLDAVLRHHPQVCFSQRHKKQIVTLLERLAAAKMSLEVNTSGFAHRRYPYPQDWILKKAIGLGIPLVAGSDSHHPSEIGRYFNLLPGLLAELV